MKFLHSQENILISFAAQGDSIVSTINNPVINDVWGHVKTAFRTIDLFKLVHDRTKDEDKAK